MPKDPVTVSGVSAATPTSTDRPSGGEAAGVEAPIERGSHVTQRAIVFEHLRLLYVPVPKAGCTALLWALAGMARLPVDRFTDSMGREVSRSMTIHDLSRWPESFRFGERSPEEKERILNEDGWLRLTVGRHPFRRLWSAWQSKVLLAEPQFVEKFAPYPWFPSEAGSAADVLSAFHDFLGALQDDPALLASDVHWAPQTDVIEHEDVAYTHLGRVEQLDVTLDLIREHISGTKGIELRALPRANVAPLPYAEELFNEKDALFLQKSYANDLALFGYEPPDSGALGRTVPPEWLEKVDATIPGLAEMRQRNQRIADLHHLLRERRDDINELKRQKRREEKLRREEHRRNQRLQRRLRTATRRIAGMESSLSWRITAPLRKAKAAVRGPQRASGGEGANGNKDD